MRASPEVVLSGITKRFGAVTALDRVDLRLMRGRIHALLGENGAGKSTLMAVLFGLVRPDQGSLRIDGADVAFRSPRDAIAAGIGMVQQHFAHVAAFTVAENVALGGQGRYDPTAAAEQVRAAAATAGLALDAGARVGDLPIEAQQRVEIVRALARGARLLILDEPTAVLAPAEATELLAWLRRFADEGGTVALVTHKVREALEVADDITVLCAGRRITTGLASTFTPATLTAAMFSETGQLSELRAPVPPATPERRVVASVRGLSLRGPRGEPRVSDATFTIEAGEIVGVAGVEGAGHAELLRALAGVQAPFAGTIDLPPEVSFVPADRHRDALVLDFPLFENLALRHVGQQSGVVDWPAVRRRTRQVLHAFDVRAGSERSRANTLSGGNQQRFILGRELELRPQLLVAENPTRGLDLRATHAIQSRLREAAASGAAVVLYSSDLDEVLALAGRILVVHRGVVREVSLDRDAVARAMVGGW